MTFESLKKYVSKIGQPPGTIAPVSAPPSAPARISVIDYDQNNHMSRQLNTIEEAFPFKDKPTVTWLNIDGLHDIELLNKIKNCFEIHSLVMEDIVNTGQRPKIEIFDNYIFVVIKMISFDNEKFELSVEQLSLIMGENYVISFQEREGDIYDVLRKRIETPNSRFRRKGSDYLMYALMDLTVDYYFSVLEALDSEIELCDELVTQNPESSLVLRIQKIKKDLLLLRRAIWPLREIASNINREEHPLINSHNVPFFRDLYDHSIQIIETVEAFREMASSLLDLYNSSMGNRMNEIMKVLTIMASIFIPLTFIAGIYGMNFEFMPELRKPWAYPAILSFMGVILVLMLFYFRRKKWL